MKNLLIATLSLLLLSCSQRETAIDSSLLNAVPADAPAVVVADLYLCAADMGMRLTSEGLINSEGERANLKILPKQISDPLIALAQRRHAVDLSHVAAFTDSVTGALIFTAMRIDGAELAEEVEKSPVAIFANDHRIWVTSKPFVKETLDSVLERAERSSIAQIKKDSEFFSSYRPVKAALRVPAFKNVAGDDFTSVYITTQIEENSLSLRLAYADSTGADVDPFNRLSAIDENVYSYLPPATAATLSLGADRHTFRSILSNYGGFLPLNQRMAAELSSGFLCDSTSTLAVGFAPGGSAETIADFSLGTWVFTALLPIEIDRTEDFIDIIDKLSQGSLQCDIAGAYLAVSNASLDQVASGDDYGTVPSNSQIRFQAVVPYRSELMKALSLRRGLSLEADCSHGHTTIRLSVHGGDEPPGQILYELLSELLKKKKIF